MYINEQLDTFKKSDIRRQQRAKKVLNQKKGHRGKEMDGCDLKGAQRKRQSERQRGSRDKTEKNMILSSIKMNEDR